MACEKRAPWLPPPDSWRQPIKGTCDLTFNEFVIRNQKSDSHHADIDWLSLAWVYGPPDSLQTTAITNLAGYKADGQLQQAKQITSNLA